MSIIAGTSVGVCVVRAGTLDGLSLQPVEVEVGSRRGPSCFQLVGLPEAAVREARVRVSSALARLGVTVDEYALTVSLAPADVRKGGAGLDLAMAVGILGATGHVEPEVLGDTLILGELSIEGLLRPTRGVLPLLQGAGQRGLERAIVPAGSAAEAAYCSGVKVFSARRLEDVLRHFQGEQTLPVVSPGHYAPRGAFALGDFSDVRAQPAAKRALEIAAAGHHNSLFIGPPGSGKTLLARLLPTILPPLSLDAALEATCVHSVAGLLDRDRGIVDEPPFRAPHHTISEAGLIGGGTVPRPGEVSLAHEGVLFLDELPEFRRGALEALRQPLEDGEVHLVRARARACYPARPLLVAAMNPCPCGNYGHPRKLCCCRVEARQRYLARLSGPLLDRIDLHVPVPPVDIAALRRSECRAPGESERVRARVVAARERQLERSKRGEVRGATNSRLSLRELESVALLTSEGEKLLAAATESLGLSARAYVRVLRVARTIADLEGTERVTPVHLAESIGARVLDRAADHAVERERRASV